MVYPRRSRRLSHQDIHGLAPDGEAIPSGDNSGLLKPVLDAGARVTFEIVLDEEESPDNLLAVKQKVTKAEVGV